MRIPTSRLVAGLAAILLLPTLLGCQEPGEASEGQGWQCANDLEVSCGDGACTAETGDAFTPMSVSFDTSGAMSVCAYSGCWEGTGEVLESDEFVVVLGRDLLFSTAPDQESQREHVAITLDREDLVATLKVGAFAQPLLCEPRLAARPG